MIRQDLVKIKSRALRTRVWFRVLSRVERAVIDLTIKCVERVRSQTLTKIVSSILSKIIQALGNELITVAEKVGLQIVEKLSMIAQKWGHTTALNWKRNKEFVIFIGLDTINTNAAEWYSIM